MGCAARELIEVPERRLELVRDLETIAAVRQGPRRGRRDGKRPSLTALKGGASWTPASVPGCILYGGAYLEARATRAGQPTLYTAAADYTPSNAAIVLADDADVPTGLSGTSIKATVSDASSRWGSRAGVYIIGNRYAAEWWGKSNGSASILLTDGSAGNLFGSTTDAAWALKSGESTVTSASLILLRSATAAGSVAYFKPVSLRNLSLQQYTPLYTTIPGSVLAQAGPTAQPWVSSDGLGIRYQNDALVWSAAASALKCMHDGTSGTLSVAVRANALNAQNRVVSTNAAGAGAVGIIVEYTNANQVRVAIGNGTGVYAYDSGAVACPIATNTVYVFTLRVAAGANGVTMRVNSTNRLTGTLNAPSAADPALQLIIGATNAAGATGVDGIVGHPFVANRVLSDAECTQVENYILAQATL
jgi:hypothetical protein